MMRVFSVVSGALLFLFLGAACNGDEPSAERVASGDSGDKNACDFRSDGSRWAPGGAQYELTAEFGRRDDEHLVDLWGIASSPRGEVLVYDAGSTRVLRLDSSLQLIDTFGRAGRGPGEFTYQRVLRGDWITANDSSIFVLDLLTLSEFGPTGDFRRYATRQVPIPHPLPIRRIATRYGRVLYVVDDIDLRNGKRALQTWQAESAAPHTLLRTDSMPMLPQSKGRVVASTLLVLQADPLWAVHRRCAFISDGAGDWILRIDLGSNRVDTLHLPPSDPPSLAEGDREWLAQGRRAIETVRGRSQFDGVTPTAQLKWANLLVDPDGFVWLEPWRPPSMRDEPMKVSVVHPATGTVDYVIVGAFPDAFLPGAAFVSRAYDPAKYLTLVQKYSLQPISE